MSDILIRDVPDDVLAAIDAQAARLGLSRSAYLRRRLAADVTWAPSDVTVSDLGTFAASHADLADPDAMRGAWE